MITLPSQYQCNFALKTDLIVCFAVFIFYFLSSMLCITSSIFKILQNCKEIHTMVYCLL